MGKYLYLFLESLRSWKHHRKVSFPTLVTLTLCAFILLFLAQVYASFARFEIGQKESWVCEVFFLNEESLQNAQVEIETWGVIQKSEMISASDAYQRFSKKYGSEMLELLPGNPLPASLEILPNAEYREPVRFSQLIHRLQQLPQVESVNSALDSLRFVADWKARLLKWGLAVLLFLLFTVWVIVRNSVQLSLFSRKILVENMKYIGASRATILFPFLLEAFLIGAGASLLSVFFLKNIFGLWLGGEGIWKDVILWDASAAWKVSLFIICLSVVTAWRAVNRYLHHA